MYIGGKVTNIRQSNIELLRIVAMFMILVFHIVFYKLYDYRTDTPLFASLMTLLHIGVPVFILISGYFGIKPSIKGVFNLYLLLLFYNLLFYCTRLALGDVIFSLREFACLWLPFSYGKSYWFFKVYIMFYILTPVVNKLKCSVLDVYRGGQILLLFGFLTFYFGWFAHSPSLLDGKNVVNFTFIYLLGDWLKIAFPINSQNRKHYRRIFLYAYLIVALVVGLALYFSPTIIQDVLKRICWGYNSPILILMSVFFFLLFTTFDFKSKTVNWIASSTFAVYLVHENPYFFVREWYDFIVVQYTNNNLFIFFIVLISSCIVLYILAILLDKVRGVIIPTKILLNGIQYCSEKTVNKIYVLINRIINGKINGNPERDSSRRGL